MMFNRKLLSISIASILLTSSLAASANTQKDEEEKDSVNSWGKWAQNYATAAGGEINTNALSFASFGQDEFGRNEQNEPGVVDSASGLCEASSVCAFSTYYAYNPNPEGEKMSTNGASGIKRMGNLSGGQVIIYGDDGQEIYRHSKPDNSGDEIYSDINRRMDLDGAYTGGFQGISEGSSAGDGNWFETVYVDGAEGSSSWGRSNWGVNGVGGSYVAGYTASLAAVEALAGMVGLNYTGSTQNGASVFVEVDLGAKSWNADFNKGSGDVVVDGRLRRAEFSVTNGSIKGVNLIATSSQLSGGATGEIQGAFFGQSANQVGGVIDVSKAGKDYSDSFVASMGKIDQGYDE